MYIDEHFVIVYIPFLEQTCILYRDSTYRDFILINYNKFWKTLYLLYDKNYIIFLAYLHTDNTSYVWVNKRLYHFWYMHYLCVWLVDTLTRSRIQLWQQLCVHVALTRRHATHHLQQRFVVRWQRLHKVSKLCDGLCIIQDGDHNAIVVAHVAAQAGAMLDVDAQYPCRRSGSRRVANNLPEIRLGESVQRRWRRRRRWAHCDARTIALRFERRMRVQSRR